MVTQTWLDLYLFNLRRVGREKEIDIIKMSGFCNYLFKSIDLYNINKVILGSRVTGFMLYRKTLPIDVWCIEVPCKQYGGIAFMFLDFGKGKI